MSFPHLLFQKLKQDQPALGAFLAMESGFGAEVLAAAGFDWLCVDLQHGLYDFSACLSLLQAIQGSSAVAFVRVPSLDAALIGRALDAGAAGIIVPSVETREQAEACAQACRYPPAGVRSVGPTRAGLLWGSDYWKHADEAALCIVMIETARGLANLEEIAATPGVNGLFAGPADLALSLGLTLKDGLGAPVLEDALARILAACHRHARIPGLFTESAEKAARAIRQGYRLLGVGLDFRFLGAAAAAHLAAVKEL